MDISTSYAGVILEGVGGAVDVRNQSGRVEVSGLTGKALAAQHRVETSYADVDFAWPGVASMAFDIECTYGSINSEFPAVSRERGSRSYAEGRVGQETSSAAALTISARNGSVNLRKR